MWLAPDCCCAFGAALLFIEDEEDWGCLPEFCSWAEARPVPAINARAATPASNVLVRIFIQRLRLRFRTRALRSLYERPPVAKVSVPCDILRSRMRRAAAKKGGPVTAIESA